MGILKAYNYAVGRVQSLAASYNALKGIVTEHERIHAGKGWTFGDVSSLASAANLDFLIMPSSEEMHLRNYSIIADGGPCVTRLYEAPFIDANSMGTLQNFYGNNRRSSNVSSVQIYEAPYIDANSIGVQLDPTLLATGTPFPGGGQINNAVVEWILHEEKPYLVRTVNNDNAAISIDTHLFWYNPVVS